MLQFLFVCVYKATLLLHVNVLTALERVPSRPHTFASGLVLVVRYVRDVYWTTTATSVPSTSSHVVLLYQILFFHDLIFVGTVCHLVIYMQSNKIHKVFQWVSLFSTHVSSTCFGPHRSIIRSVLYKLYSQTLVCAVISVPLPHAKSAHTACTKRSWWWTDEVRNMSS